MSILFISDLHLDSQWPEITEQFFAFLRDEAAHASALYILGDLFETWIGDDDPDPHKAAIGLAIRELADSGVTVYFMHGNRDFVLGPAFAAKAGLTLLDDPCVLDLAGESVALMHGDSLCTDDAEYQAFRAMVRNPDWQRAMLARSLDERRAFAARARMASLQGASAKNEQITDVNDEAVAQRMSELGVRTLVHGHTHRPAVHELEVDGVTARRIVLGDWYEQASVLDWSEQGGFRLESRSRG
jgi:UDP-2,3-diacylglucosamine hydrolase